jgi:hypothetical protein
MNAGDDMNAGDIHPKYPDVVRVRMAGMGHHVCRGCPIDLGTDPEDDSLCGEHPCGTDFVWYSEHIAAVNKVRRRDAE